jgi:hypothetical protein
MKTKQSNYDRYLQTYSGQELLKKHSREEVGIRKVLGEDSNCDMGGTHYQPELGIFEGKLEDIIRHAVELRSFWQWGGGGSIREIGKPIKIDANTTARLSELRVRKELLDAELAVINRELKVLA